MDYQLTDAYRRLIETRDALDKLHHELCGRWPLEHETPADIAARISDAFTRQRENAIESAFVDYGMDPNDVRRLF